MTRLSVRDDEGPLVIHAQTTVFTYLFLKSNYIRVPSGAGRMRMSVN